MSTIPPEERFHVVISQISSKINEKLAEMEEDGKSPIPTILSRFAVSYIHDYKDKKKMITNFIRKSYSHWDQVRNRDIDFFCKHAGEIFGDIPVSGISEIFDTMVHAKRDDGSYYINDKERETWWAFFDSMLRICISYAHENSGPQAKIEGGKQIFSYSKDAFAEQDDNYPRFDILKEAAKIDEAARKNNVFKFSVRDRLVFPITNSL